MFRPLILLAPLSLGLAMAPLSAAPLKPSYRLQDHGAPREFVVAQDEVHQSRRPARIPARASLEETRTTADGLGADLVLYEKGLPHSVATRRLLTRRIAVQLAPGSDPAAVAALAGLVNRGPVKGVPGWVIFEAEARAGSSLLAAEALRRLPGVLAADPQLARAQAKRFSPNDALFGDQWNLHNTGTRQGLAGIDLNVMNAWNSYQGDGITIGIVDDGLQTNHPDLAPNYRADVSYDFNQLDNDPLPPPFDGDDHGTACASLAAAKGNNGFGLAGVAFNAQLAGLRLIAFPTTDADEAAAFAYRNDAIQIKSNSWGPYDTGRLFEGPGPLAVAALEDAVQNGRGGFGTIFVWAGGNGAGVGDSSSFDGYASHRTVIAVGGVDNTGHQAYYSESGANLLCVAPTSGGTLEVTTADRPGEDGYNYTGAPLDYANHDYTNSFGGTSAAAPQVAGVVALMLQANPQLGWRDVKEILIRTSRVVSAATGGWVTNGAKFRFNDRFGAGLVDATAATNLAATWTKLPAEISISEELANLADPIPDAKPLGLTKTFVVNDQQLRVEQVVLDVDILHALRGQLEITLTSPFGTVTKMAPVRLRDRAAHFLGARFSTPHFWGEMAHGTWTLKIVDKAAGTVGTLRRARLELYGSSSAGHVAPGVFTLSSDVNANGFVDAGEQVTGRFTLQNNGAADLTGLTATLQTSGGVAPLGPQTAPVASLPAGGSTQVTFSFGNTAATGDTLHASVVLQQAGVEIGSVIFEIPVGVIETKTFSSTEAIEIPGYPRSIGNAAPYGGTVSVTTGVATPIVQKVVLHLDHFNHGRSADVDMLLVSPAGKAMIPISDVGGEYADDLNLVLADDATVTLPGTSLLYSGTYRPANLGSTLDSFPHPAPPRPWGANFAVFQGTNANGVWKLYVRDDASGKYGGLGSWSLEITYAH